jgi:hypothetical protein
MCQSCQVMLQQSAESEGGGPCKENGSVGGSTGLLVGLMSCGFEISCPNVLYWVFDPPSWDIMGLSPQ